MSVYANETYRNRLIQLGEKYELPLNVFGSDGIPSFNFDSKNNLKYGSEFRLLN